MSPALQADSLQLSHPGRFLGALHSPEECDTMLVCDSVPVYLYHWFLNPLNVAVIQTSSSFLFPFYSVLNALL